MITFSLDTTKVTKALNDKAAGLKDFSVPFNRAGDDLLEYYGDVMFESNGIESGQSWRALSPSTIMMRQRHYGYYKNPSIAEGKTLVWTGRLKQGFRKLVDAKSMIIDNPVEYFKYHQLGGGKIPKRRMLALNKNTISFVMSRIEEYVNEIMST